MNLTASLFDIDARIKEVGAEPLVDPDQPEGRYIYLPDVVRIIHEYHDRLTAPRPDISEAEQAYRKRIGDEMASLADFFRTFEST